MSRAALILVIVAAVAPAACGGGSSAATDAATGGDAAVDAVVMRCDPFTQDCPTGSKCDFVCDGTITVACRADNGGGTPGSACASTTSCAKGAACLTMSVDAGGTCLKFCAGDGDCATGERCHNLDATLCGGPLDPMFVHVCY